jgi:hypothetical protein
MTDRPCRLLLSATLLALALPACRSSATDIPLDALELPPSEQLLEVDHRGPPVVAGGGGPARFAAPLLDDFNPSSARRLLAFIDGFYRAPANDGYEAVLERLERELREAGYGSQPGLELYYLERPLEGGVWGDRSRRHEVPAWTPLSARVGVLSEGREPRYVQRFEGPLDPDRTMLPVNAPSGLAEGTVAFDLDGLQPGQVLVMQAPPNPSTIRRAFAAGAVAVLSSNLEAYNVDPTGADRHLDAIQYRRLPYGSPIPVCMISPRAYESIESACLADPLTQVRVEAEVRFDERPLRTLVAVVRGADRPQEAFAVMSHIQEPGANDNGTGVVGLLESARSVASLLRDGRFEQPSRSLVFLWGDEYRQTTTWLEQTDMTPVGGLSSDMTGASFEQTGAICLLERMPDPGAIRPLPPDEHTPWGAEEVLPEDLAPNGLAVIARCAMADVAALEPGWRTAEHPYESGSDHDMFIRRGLPGALIWHFTDFTYHTSIDRLNMVDYDELRRTAVVIMATALAMADPQPADLDRYLRTLDHERSVRVEVAQASGDAELEQMWRDWCEGARHWLRWECLRIPESER